jgi:PPOX class probable F420-dependent enzyme
MAHFPRSSPGYGTGYVARARLPGKRQPMTAAPSSQLDAFLAEPRNVIVAGIRKDGRPHLTPNWFVWDGDKFYVSTTRQRVKYKLFRRDPRVELVIDDPTGHRYVQADGQLAAELAAEDRVMLAITPSGPPATWTVWGLA